MLVSVKEGRFKQKKKGLGRNSNVAVYLCPHTRCYWALKKMKTSKFFKGIVEELRHATNNFSIQKQIQ